MSKTPKVAVVILNWNGKKWLEKFLPSVIETNYNTLEIVVADNASTDDSLAFLNENYPEITQIVLEKNWGFADGYNKALEKVEADYFVLLNSDVEVEEDWISPIVDQMEKDVSIGAAQPKIRDQKQKELFEYAGASGGFLDFLGYSFCRGRLFDDLEIDEGQYDDPIEICWATGAALFIRAELYHNIGGLDGDFFAHFEEIDLCWRIRRAGYKIMVFPDSVVYHYGGGTLATSSPRKTYLNYRNNLLMILKNETGSRLLGILFIRLNLDVISSFKLLLDGEMKKFLAVYKAVFAFLFNCIKWYKKRQEMNKVINEIRIGSARSEMIYSKSVVWQYFKNGVKIFSQLPYSK